MTNLAQKKEYLNIDLYNLSVRQIWDHEADWQSRVV